MASYTITLKTKEDFQIIKKILKAFDGASIVPTKTKKTNFEKAMEEAESGKISGPFTSVESLMSDLLN